MCGCLGMCSFHFIVSSAAYQNRVHHCHRMIHRNQRFQNNRENKGKRKREDNKKCGWDIYTVEIKRYGATVLMRWLQGINRYIFGPAFPVFLCIAGLVMWGMLGGRLLRRPVEALRAMRGGEGGFRALTLALAGTLGVGNIVGVAVALQYGGAGALFWMWMSAICMMPVKYAEIYLSTAHRIKSEDGYHGGPMYYIPTAFTNKRWGKRAAAIFAILCLVASFCLGNLIQIRAAADAVNIIGGLPPYITAAMMLFAALFLIFSDRRRLTKFTSIAIPFFCAGYCVFSLMILIMHREMLGTVCARIFSEAFSFRAAGGGIGATLFSAALRHGCAKGVFSHEGGCGTAPISYAGMEHVNPVGAGLWGVLEIFVDTMILCTMTGLVLLLFPGQVDGGLDFVVRAFGYFGGKTAQIFIAGAVIVFAFSTLVCWSYYGGECIRYFTSSPRAKKGYRILFCLAVIPGVFAAEEMVWELNDFCTMCMTLLNVSVLLRLLPEIRNGVTNHTSRSDLKRVRPLCGKRSKKIPVSTTGINTVTGETKILENTSRCRKNAGSAIANNK